MLTKPEFTAAIDELRAGRDLAASVNKLFRDSPLNTDFSNASGMAVFHDGLAVQLLDKLMGGGDWVTWWAFECDYGRDHPNVHDNCQEATLDTAEKLYDFLVSLPLG